jgi:hypothetical protein
VPKLIDLDEVNGSNLTAPVPALMDPPRETSFARIVTPVFVTLIGAASESDAVVEVEASNTNETGPEELMYPGWKTVSSSTTVPDLLAL